MNNAVSNTSPSYQRLSATSGANRRSKFVAHSHALTHAASASRVCLSPCADTTAARLEKHLHSAPHTPLTKRTLHSSKQPVVQVSTAQTAIESIVNSRINKQAPKIAADFAGSQAKDLKTQASQEADPAKRQALLGESAKWEEGGVYRVAMHTVIGGLAGGASGALGAGSSASAAPLIDQLQSGLQAELEAAGVPPSVAKATAAVVGNATAAGIGAAAGGGSGAAMAFNVDANNRQLHPSERALAKQLAAKSGGKYTVEQVENAMRNAGNSAYGEDITKGMVVNVDSANKDIYDKGAQFTVGADGKSLVQVLPNGGKVDPGLTDFISANTGGSKGSSPYSWGNEQTGRVTPPAASAGNSSGGSNGTKPLRYEIVSANGQTFSLPIADCPAVSCTNGDNIARFGLSPKNQATLEAYDAALNKQGGKAAVTAVLVVGTAVALPVTLGGVALGGAIVGGGTSAADQAIDGKPIDPTKVAVDTATGAVVGAVTYGVVKGAGVLSDSAGTAVPTAEEAAAIARARINNNVYAEGASSSPAGLNTSAGTIPANPDKTTTVLGRYKPDMESAIETQMAAPKSSDFGARPGGFNVLNVDDATANAAGSQFFEKINKPFLEAAVKRNDDIALATIPKVKEQLFTPDGKPSGMFGLEVQFLVEKGVKPVNVSAQQWNTIKGWFKK